MLFVSYFEGIDSQRGVALPGEDSPSLQLFLGLMNESTPDHSSPTRIRDRFPIDVVDCSLRQLQHPHFLKFTKTMLVAHSQYPMGWPLGELMVQSKRGCQPVQGTI